MWYKPTSEQNKIQSHILLAALPRDVICESLSSSVGTKSLEEAIENIEMDFDKEITNKLKQIIMQLERTVVSDANNEYFVKVSLKDISTYVYSPRRFSWFERNQIREIIDDLLKRGIVKHSTSPYCARIVPIKKKNGDVRLCVDLRPLNSRVLKQKYPFPLIEDCSRGLVIKQFFRY